MPHAFQHMKFTFSHFTRKNTWACLLSAKLNQMTHLSKNWKCHVFFAIATPSMEFIMDFSARPPTCIACVVYTVYTHSWYLISAHFCSFVHFFICLWFSRVLKFLIKKRNEWKLATQMKSNRQYSTQCAMMHSTDWIHEKIVREKKKHLIQYIAIRLQTYSLNKYNILFALGVANHILSVLNTEAYNQMIF